MNVHASINAKSWANSEYALKYVRRVRAMAVKDPVQFQELIKHHIFSIPAHQCDYGKHKYSS